MRREGESPSTYSTKKVISMKIKSLLRHFLCYLHKYRYHKDYVRLLKNNKLTSVNGDVKKEWIRKWSVLGQRPDAIYFDVFAHYIGESPNIVPENICHDIIERILNPVHYDGYYADKNNFDKLFPKGVLPTTILRKMNGFYLDAEYRMVEVDNTYLLKALNNSGFDKVIVKPTLDSCSGRGVKLAIKDKYYWTVVGDNVPFSYDYLQTNYGADLIIQEALTQCDYMSQFNPTSVNTLRLTVYRSVKTNQCCVPSAIMRIGGKGSIMDNAHTGGGYTALKLDGTLGDKVLDQYGKAVTVFNDIDFTQRHKIPNFSKIIDFAKKVGECVLNHRLLALDIMIDTEGNPRLIEFNTGTTGAYSMWFFQFTWTPAFGEYTDEIIDYCKEHLNNAKMQYYI